MVVRLGWTAMHSVTYKSVSMNMSIVHVKYNNIIIDHYIFTYYMGLSQCFNTLHSVLTLHFLRS